MTTIHHLLTWLQSDELVREFSLATIRALTPVLLAWLATRLIVKMRTGEYKPSDVGALLNVLTKLGLTPTSRRKLNLEPPVTVEPTQTEEDKRWAELDQLD
jgi:hypothetical protein